MALQLSVNANVTGAQVMVNNVAKGAAPYAESLPIGTYTVRVFADGYLDYQANVSLTQPVALNIQLQPKPMAPATLAVVIPRPFVDPDLRPGDPQTTIQIWVDDKLVNPKRELAGIQIPPGKHRVRIGIRGAHGPAGRLRVPAGYQLHSGAWPYGGREDAVRSAIGGRAQPADIGHPETGSGASRRTTANRGRMPPQRRSLFLAALSRRPESRRISPAFFMTRRFP